MRVSFCAAVFSVLLGCGLFVARADIELVSEKRSEYSIVVPAGAAGSVKDAAAELAKVIELASGAILPIVEDSADVAGPVVSLGSTRQATAAGFVADKMEDEEHRIAVAGSDLFILGPDTPDGGWTANNGVSHGTANGVYVFIEDFLDSRWLMPGDYGRDVPLQATIVVPAVDKTAKPEFSYRNVRYLDTYATRTQAANMRAWARRQRVGGSTALSHGHYWWQTLNGDGNGDPNTPRIREIYEKHPEWFAMNSRGERPFPANHYAKLETTNREFVRFYAERAVATLKATERPRTYSLSPSDGQGWSQSPESLALYDPPGSEVPDPESPGGTPSMSSLVLQFYTDVARIVKEEYPEGRLAGYIYASFVYPPRKVKMKLPDNFTPVICGIGTYGYGLYRPENQERWKWVMDEWAKVAPENWFYYDLPNQLLRQYHNEIGRDANIPGSSSILMPAAPDIMNRIFSQLLESRIKGGLIYGVHSWSSSALHNYINAKMLWEPTADAYELQREWLTRAYGSRAGAIMENLQSNLNARFGEYYRENPAANYSLTYKMLRELIAPAYPEMERAVLRAKSQPMTELQARRLSLQEENLIALQWRLRNAGMLPKEFESPLRRDDAQINELVSRDDDEFPHFPGAASANTGQKWFRTKRLPFTVEASTETPEADEAGALPGMGDGQILLFSTENREISIRTEFVEHGAYFATYFVQNSRGAIVRKGIIQNGAPIVFEAEANEAYTLTLPDRKPVQFRLCVEGAAIAKGSLTEKTLRLRAPNATLFAYFAPRKMPLGLLQNEDGVMILKPFSGGVAGHAMTENYDDARMLQALDMGWRLAADPEDVFQSDNVLGADYDDSEWTLAHTLSWWQTLGIEELSDYRGVAWYRIKLNHAELREGERAVLVFGAVDGHTEAFVNGDKVVERILPPTHEGWDQPFTVDVTDELKAGENMLVVKVTSKNDTSATGIFKGVSLMAGRRK